MADAVAFCLRFGKSGGPPKRFELSLGDGRAVKIGRFAKNDVVVDLPGISWRHSELRLLAPAAHDLGGPRLGIVDLSSNCTGLKVPGGSVMRLPKGVETALPHGSLIVLPLKLKSSEQAPAEALRMCFVVELERPGGVPPAADPGESGEGARRHRGLPPEQDVTAAAAAAQDAIAALQAMNSRSAGGAAPVLLQPSPATPPSPAPAFLPPPSQAPAQPSVAPARVPSWAPAAEPLASAPPRPGPAAAAAAPAEQRRPDRPRRGCSEERGGRAGDRGRQERGGRRSRSRRRSPHDHGRDRRDRRSRSRRRDDRGDRGRERGGGDERGLGRADSGVVGDERERWGSNRTPVGSRAVGAPAGGGGGHALAVGAEVDVRYRGKWWDGKVVAPPCFGKVRCFVDGREYDMEESDVRPKAPANEPSDAERTAGGDGAEPWQRGGWSDEAPSTRQARSRWPTEEHPAEPGVSEAGAPSSVMSTGQLRAMMDAKAAAPAQAAAADRWAVGGALFNSTCKAPSFGPPPGRPPLRPPPALPKPSSAIGARAGAAPAFMAPPQHKATDEALETEAQLSARLKASISSKSRGAPPKAPPAEAEWRAALDAKAAAGPPAPPVGFAAGSARQPGTNPKRAAVMEWPSPESPK